MTDSNFFIQISYNDTLFNMAPNTDPLTPDDIELFNSMVTEDFISFYAVILSRIRENDKKLSKEQIDKLSYENKEFECSICYTTREDKINLDCNHSFCKKCLSKWFSKSNTCPNCRKEIHI